MMVTDAGAAAAACKRAVISVSRL